MYTGADAATWKVKRDHVRGQAKVGWDIGIKNNLKGEMGKVGML